MRFWQDRKTAMPLAGFGIPRLTPPFSVCPSAYSEQALGIP
jgi:hypothetical protein